MTYRELEFYKGYRIQIVQDEDPPNPRTEYDNLGTMICFLKRYDLGDKDVPYSYRDFDSWRELLDALWDEQDAAVILPLYLYDHSGITIRTGTAAFRAIDSAGWDWGQVGFIYISKNKVREEYGWKKLTKKRLAKIEEYLKNEVEAYDQYLTGDVWGYVVDTYIGEAEEDDEPVDPEDYLETDDLWEEAMETYYTSGGKDAEGNIIWKPQQMPISCWGFFGKSYCLEEARSIVDGHIEDLAKEEAERVSKIETGHKLLFEERSAVGL